MPADTEIIKKPAPTLYAIIIIKLLKGLLFVGLAVIAYTLSDNDLPKEYASILHHLKINPERKFWADLARQIGQITESKVLWAAAGTLVYSLFSLVEAFGLMFRVSWAGWLAIGESAFFIPIEIYELARAGNLDPARHAGHPVTLLIILGLNILIVWYLFQNRRRLFRHHHHSP